MTPTPIPLESAANVAFGHAKDDVVRAAEALRETWIRPHGGLHAVTVGMHALTAALDRLTALGWVPGPERVGTAPAPTEDAP